MPAELLTLPADRRDHFQMDSGYHSERWFDLNALFADRERLLPFSSANSRASWRRTRSTPWSAP